MEKNLMDILRTKAMLNFALFFFSKEAKMRFLFLKPALKAPILISNDSLTSEESKAKNRLQIPYMQNELGAF